MTPSQLWVCEIDTEDRPGVLMAVSAVFSNRGISLRSITAKGSALLSQPTGAFVLTFECSIAKKEHLARLLGRNPSVRQVRLFALDDPALQLVGMVRARHPAQVQAQAGLQVVPVALDATGAFQDWLLHGPAAAFKTLLDSLRAQSALLDYHFSILPPASAAKAPRPAHGDKGDK